ncbi:MAG: hypothetical protein IJK42_14370 [Prevotella sp.]|nr:hypothetical protein [Prevotella sp.]MBQ6210932.1 hypothetical protein [Prevotella sp.]
MAKGIDGVFLHYGVRKEDMALIEQSCQENDIDANWLKEYILKPYNEERNNQGVLTVDDKKLAKILKKALKNI